MPTIASVLPGQIFYISEKFGDSKNGGEVRETFYRRLEDGECRHPYAVKTERLATIQGTPGEQPRYCVILKEPYPNETDGRVGCVVLNAPSVWSHLLEV